ncbi:MAG: ParB N-terminal domain-containing protein, partial [Chloroflexota bacterium]|nr:ParB N-terminal domain-containing protein [Chloroflexota bacterium]
MPDQEPNEHEPAGQERDRMVAALSSLTPDPRNARKHSDRNLAQIEAALREVGAARSIVVDEAGVILAGNATVQAAMQAGLSRVRVVEADGTDLVAVRRSGLTPEQKRRLALHDNRAAELAEWDTEVLASLADELD